MLSAPLLRALWQKTAQERRQSVENQVVSVISRHLVGESALRRFESACQQRGRAQLEVATENTDVHVAEQRVDPGVLDTQDVKRQRSARVVDVSNLVSSSAVDVERETREQMLRLLESFLSRQKLRNCEQVPCKNTEFSVN